MSDPFAALARRVTTCERCPRLREYCRAIAKEKRRAFLGWEYWGRPVPGFGDPAATVWIVGLAPAAHGANRTGRVFTGDRSGDFLFASLFRLGAANQPQSVSRDDGLTLRTVYVSAAARCAPPDNKPLPLELANCSSYLDREWELLTRKKVIVALGRIGWDAASALIQRHGGAKPPTGTFGHGATWDAGAIKLMGSYHVSQQNTFTGKLTPAMFDEVMKAALAVR